MTGKPLYQVTILHRKVTIHLVPENDPRYEPGLAERVMRLSEVLGEARRQAGHSDASETGHFFNDLEMAREFAVVSLQGIQDRLATELENIADYDGTTPGSDPA